MVFKWYYNFLNIFFNYYVFDMKIIIFKVFFLNILNMILLYLLFFLVLNHI